MLPSPMKALRRATKDKRPDELHLAVLTGRTKKIKHLLKKGVHIESVNSHGQTPLFCAAFGGDHEIVSLLLRLGANPNRKCGSSGATPVHAASYRGSRRVLRLLVEFGGDLSLEDFERQTPRDYALKQPSPLRRQKIINFLDLLVAMTLHTSRTPVAFSGHSSPMGTLKPMQDPTVGGLLSQKTRGLFGGSQICLAKKLSGSSANLRNALQKEDHPESAAALKVTDEEIAKNLPKSVSCHLLDQLCVTTSLPLLSPAQLERPTSPTIAYTCGGPTVYSPYTWLGTPVTVRRPTPALSYSRSKSLKVSGDDDSAPDAEAVKSLLQELSVLRRLRHPGFLEVMAACHVTHPAPDHVTLVYQHVPYGSLYYHLHVQHRDLSVGCAVDILIGFVEALLFLHAHGWLHAGLTSHALHLVALGHAKLGSFEYAMETQAKGCAMRAEHLVKAEWLRPWQAPEVVVENMVSVRSEIYSVAAIIWEIWSGMAPWCGVDEAEVGKRVASGECLPALVGSAPSLISYLTQYGLKWHSHERDLDLQEVHTMLRSLRVQIDINDRVPAVTSWGPPSIPNTPVVGRHSAQTCCPAKPLPERLEDKNSFEQSLGKEVSGRTGTPTNLKENVFHNMHSQRDQTDFISQRKQSLEVHRPLAAKSMSIAPTSYAMRRKSTDAPLQSSSKGKGEDSGFSTPSSRTPSPTYETVSSSRPNCTVTTSTPVKPSISQTKCEKQPDLLPNKITPAAFLSANSPDLLSRGQNDSQFSPVHGVTPVSSDEESVRGYGYVSNAAKRAFLESGEDPDAYDNNGSLSSLVGSSVRGMDVVKRGLSLTNICSSVHNTATIFTRTTSHISLSSSSSSSSGELGRRPQRTISQITLTMKKLALSSASSKDDLTEPDPRNTSKANDSEVQSRTYRSNSVPKSPVISTRTSPSHLRHWDEITGIKPASHQLVKHSSTCSLASCPPSPAYQQLRSSHSYVPWTREKLVSSHSSLVTSPARRRTLPAIPIRPSSLCDDSSSVISDASKGSLKKYSEGVRHKTRKNRRRPEVEVEEEFFDDEFNASLYEQPHMQLSVGSSENLLESRLCHSTTRDGFKTSADVKPQRNSSYSSGNEEETKEMSKEVLKSVAELEDSDGDPRAEDAGGKQEDVHRGDVLDRKITETSDGENVSPDVPPSVKNTSDSDVDDVFLCSSSKLDSKGYEVLKSVQLLKNLGKDLSCYLPKYSVGSDTEGGDS